MMERGPKNCFLHLLRYVKHDASSVTGSNLRRTMRNEGLMDISDLTHTKYFRKYRDVPES